MKENEKLGQFLKAARVKQNLSQAELGETLGVHSQYVSNYERGLCVPPMHSIDVIIKTLKIDPKKLVAVMLEDSRRIIEGKVYTRPKRSTG